MPEATKNAHIEVFRTGTFTPMGGSPLTFSADTLRAVASGYDRAAAPAPVVVGHPKTDDPAFGWVERFEFNEESGVLSADIGEIEPSFAAAVANGRYKKVSMSFFRPKTPANPKPGTFYPKHVGFLGAVPPAVPGLKPVAFAECADDEVVTFEGLMDFGTFDAENVGALFRGIRDWIIEQFGKEKADEVIPSWRIDWVNDLEIKAEDSPAYAAPSTKEPKEKEKLMPDENDAAFAAREADIAKREAEIARREAAAQHEEHLAFAESLVEGEKLLPASRDKVVALLDATAAVDGTVSFADSEAPLDFTAAIREILEAQPKIIHFGALDLGEDPDDVARPVNFAVADGATVDADSARIDAKARRYQADHPGVDYIGAVLAVQAV